MQRCLVFAPCAVSWPCVLFLPSLGCRLVVPEISPEPTGQNSGLYSLLVSLVHVDRVPGKGDGATRRSPRHSPCACCPVDWSYPPRGRHSPTLVRPRRPRARRRQLQGGGRRRRRRHQPPPQPLPLILPPRTSASERFRQRHHRPVSETKGSRKRARRRQVPRRTAEVLNTARRWQQCAEPLPTPGVTAAVRLGRLVVVAVGLCWNRERVSAVDREPEPST